MPGLLDILFLTIGFIFLSFFFFFFFLRLILASVTLATIMTHIDVDKILANISLHPSICTELLRPFEELLSRKYAASTCVFDVMAWSC